MWLDSMTLSISERSPTGTQLSLLNVRNGDRRNVLQVQDSLLQDFAPLGDSGWIWIPIGRRSIQVHDRPSEPTRELPRPDWYRSLVHVTATPDGRLAAVTGWDTKTNDSLGIFVVTLPEGKETPWATLFGEEARPKYLDDGTLLVTVYLSQEIASLMRLRGPGALEFVGTIPRRVDAVTISRDRRVVGLTTVDYRGDAWMSRVVRPE
jgi:hypothetical protein